MTDVQRGQGGSDAVRPGREDELLDSAVDGRSQPGIVGVRRIAAAPGIPTPALPPDARQYSAARNVCPLIPVSVGAEARISSRRMTVCLLPTLPVPLRDLVLIAGSVTTTHPQACRLPPVGPRTAASRIAHITSSGMGSVDRNRRDGVECNASISEVAAGSINCTVGSFRLVAPDTARRCVGAVRPHCPAPIPSQSLPVGRCTSGTRTAVKQRHLPFPANAAAPASRARRVLPELVGRGDTGPPAGELRRGRLRSRPVWRSPRRSPR